MQQYKQSMFLYLVFGLINIIGGQISLNTIEIHDLIKQEIEGIECEDAAQCDFNPDMYLDTVQIAQRHGYPAESHQVTTDDGYILTLHRIPGAKSGARGGQPVFLQHGLLSSSTDWVDEGNNSLAFVLADLGYDVWMGNARGNTYSKAHRTLSVKSAQFWNFSWHEMGVFDLPAALYHVSNATNRPGEIVYIGHSMGGTMFFVFASERPDAAKNVVFMAGLAPAVYMTHVRSPIRYLTPFTSDWEFIARFIGINEFLPNGKLMKYLAQDCAFLQIDEYICAEILFVFGGFNKEETDREVLPVVISHDPAGTSTKTVLHYSQEIKNAGKFQQYDWGTKGNIAKYGTPDPPLYNLSRVAVPNFLMYGMGDVLASYVDIIQLSKNLSTNVGAYEVKLKSFNHVDFLFGKDVKKLVYKPLIQMMQNYKYTILNML